jgi:isopenicillin-N N-acyltransferase like protein
MVQPCRLIELSGSPYDRGAQYGRQAAQEIARSVAHYCVQAKALDVNDDRLAQIVREYLPILENFDHRQIEEMRGVAAGAGVSFEHIVLVNARSELFQFALRPELLESMKVGVSDGCTGVVVRPAAARDKQLIHAHNWDWKYESADSSVILRIRNEDGPDILTFTEAGALARFGLNAYGICITANGLECDRDYRRAGVPLALIRRKVLEQDHLALALRIAYTTPKSGSNNIPERSTVHVGAMLIPTTLRGSPTARCSAAIRARLRRWRCGSSRRWRPRALFPFGRGAGRSPFETTLSP